MGSGLSLKSDHNFVKLQDGYKKLTLKYVKKNRVPPNLKIYMCCKGCTRHNPEVVYAYHWAAAHCDRETFNYLLKKSSLQDEYDASVNIRTKTLKTPLMYAALHNKHANVRILANDLHCEVNSKDIQGQTALHHAARLGYVEVVKELLKSPDINLNMLDHFENTPLEEALHYNMKEVAECLKNQGASYVDVRTNSWRKSYRSYTSTLDSGLQELMRDNSSSLNKFGSLYSQEEQDETSVRNSKEAEDSQSEVNMANSARTLSSIEFIDMEDEEEGFGVAKSAGGPCQNDKLDEDQADMAKTLKGKTEDKLKVDTVCKTEESKDKEGKNRKTEDESKTETICESDEGRAKESQREGTIKAEVEEGSYVEKDQVEKYDDERVMEFQKIQLDPNPIIVTAEIHTERGVVNCYDRKLEHERMLAGRGKTGVSEGRVGKESLKQNDSKSKQEQSVTKSKDIQQNQTIGTTSVSNGISSKPNRLKSLQRSEVRSRNDNNRGKHYLDKGFIFNFYDSARSYCKQCDNV